MNLLCDSYPETLDVSGEIVPINSDFRHALRVLRALEDKRLTDKERAYILLRQIYRKMPVDLQEAMKKASWYLQGGKDVMNGDDKGGQRLYSFDKDDKLIFSAFLQTHGVNLRTANLHWWEFLALFADLGGETGFSQMVHLRYLVKNEMASNDDLARANQLGDAFYLEGIAPGIESLTAEEIANQEAFWREWNKGK